MVAAFIGYTSEGLAVRRGVPHFRQEPVQKWIILAAKQNLLAPWVRGTNPLFTAFFRVFHQSVRDCVFGTEVASKATVRIPAG
jgi:hypothetical protein